MPGVVFRNYKDRVVESISECNAITELWNITNAGQGVIVKNAYKDFPSVGLGDATVTTPGSSAYYKWLGDSFIKISESESLDVVFDTSAFETIIHTQNSSSTTVSVAGIDAYTGNLNPAITAYVKGQTFTLTDVVANASTNPTLSLNGLAAKNIVNYKNAALSVGDFVGTVVVIYDGDAFRMIGGGSSNAASVAIAKYSLFHFNSNLFTEQFSSFRGLITIVSSYLTDQLSSVSFEVRLDTVSVWTALANLVALQTWINTNITGSESSGTVYWVKVLATYKVGGLGDAEVRLTYMPS
ncbi:MAG TPA: hypothetical protein VIM65_15840 [Cyclobacteriaceae bacterium]